MEILMACGRRFVLLAFKSKNRCASGRERVEGRRHGRACAPSRGILTGSSISLTPRVKVRAMDNPLFPCVAVLDANREVLRVARRRERHLWHLVLLAAAGRGGRFRPADSIRYPLAGQRAPLNPVACAWRWTRPMAARIDPVPRWGKRRFRSGGLRCEGSSRSSFRPGPRTS